jgi:hypothetical protein
MVRSRPSVQSRLSAPELNPKGIRVIINCMTTREYMFVSAIVLVGLVPAFFTYRYLQNHSSVLSSLECGVTQIEQSPQMALGVVAAAVNDSTNAIVEVYQSRPQKETTGLCKNSYYMSFALIIYANSKFSLMKNCESSRDSLFTWYGMASTTWTTSTATSTNWKNDQTRGFSVIGDVKGTYEKPINIIFSHQSDDMNNIKVLQTELKEISTTTVFARVSV